MERWLLVKKKNLIPIIALTLGTVVLLFDAVAEGFFHLDPPGWLMVISSITFISWVTIGMITTFKVMGTWPIRRTET
jgi:hypothetical protein